MLTLNVEVGVQGRPGGGIGAMSALQPIKFGLNAAGRPQGQRGHRPLMHQKGGFRALRGRIPAATLLTPRQCSRFWATCRAEFIRLPYLRA